MFDRSAHLYDLVYAFKDYEAEARDLVALIHERNSTAHSLLDVACGTGEHLKILRPTFDVVEGVDAERTMLEIARAKLPDVVFTLADMRTFDLGRAFDAVTCLFSSVGYMPGTDDLNAAIARMAAHLAPGGVLVVDGWIRPDAWRPGTNLGAEAATANDVAAARVVRTWREGDHTRLHMRYLAATADGFEEAEELHVLTLFTAEEYRAAFAAAGLHAEELPGPMGPDRDRYLGVAP